MKAPQKLVLLIVVSVLVLAISGVVYEAVRAAGGGKERPDFTASTLDGKPWSLAEHRGRRPVLLSFFATWCGPCAMERPHLVDLQRRFADRGLQVVLLTREPADLIRQYPDLVSCPLTLLTDAGEAFDRYGINPIPHTVFFDERGQVVEEIEGYSPSGLKGIEKRLEAMAAR